MSNRLVYTYVALFLAAIVLANLAVNNLGVSALPFTAFFLIPFDLVTRDILHEKWQGDNLWKKMFILILSGGIITYLLNRNAVNIAIASVSAFTLASIVDVVVYSILQRKSLFVKMNTSNLFSAVTDSIIFPSIAFGAMDLEIVLMQSSSKFFGGLFWFFIIVKVLKIRK